MQLFSKLLLMAGILGGWVNTSAQVFSNDDLTITRFENNMWVVETSDKTTMYIIEGSEKALLIDTGTKCEKLDEVVRHITQKPLTVVITHAHSDHSGNIGFFGEIWLHPADTVLLPKSYKGVVSYMADGQIFDLGGTRLEVVHTPGHTPGSVVLLDRASGNCYSGDSFGSGQVWLQLRPFSPISTYVASCIKMEELMDQGIRKIYCGHYPHANKAFDKTYITDMRQLAEALEAGTAADPEPYPIKLNSMGSFNPMMVTRGEAKIVYEPGRLK
jgi:hydroxyacylglutathione hydrolase